MFRTKLSAALAALLAGSLWAGADSTPTRAVKGMKLLSATASFSGQGTIRLWCTVSETRFKDVHYIITKDGKKTKAVKKVPYTVQFQVPETFPAKDVVVLDRYGARIDPLLLPKLLKDSVPVHIASGPKIDAKNQKNSKTTRLVLILPEFQVKQPPGKARAKTPQAWTLPEALDQLRLNSHDAYVQYVALQLARREKRLESVVREMDELLGTESPSDETDRRGQVDLVSLFSGALAVQESLQLDTMRPDGSRPGSRIPIPAGETPDVIERIKKENEEKEKAEGSAAPPWRNAAR